MTHVFRCPTCRSAWRGVATCPRCGGDLGGLMRLAARAWELREAARAALCAGDRPADALALAREACRLHETPRGQHLLALALLANGQRVEAARYAGRIVRADAKSAEDA
jgi:hypothetical protein